jgi:hypothetical protein
MICWLKVYINCNFFLGGGGGWGEDFTLRTHRQSYAQEFDETMFLLENKNTDC